MDFDRGYAAMTSRDARFDGWFFVGVTTTGIYCRPSCPTPVQPRRDHVRFYPSAAAAQRAGLRACKRCRPDATPGSPEWDTRGDLVGRAMRLLADGLVDREGTTGLARRLGVSARHLHRLLVAEVGAPPLALARAQRAQAARVLIETTGLPLTEVAYAAGFGSIRQFNDTVREVFATTPGELRRLARTRYAGPAVGTAGVTAAVTIRLAHRLPYDTAGVWAFLAARAVPGVEAVGPDGAYRRSLRLPGGPGTVSVTPQALVATFRLTDLTDLAPAVRRVRALLDLDADPQSVAGHLGRDPALAAPVAAQPGLRSPGTVDGAELAVRAVLGQQVSLAAARRLAGLLAAGSGEPLPLGLAGEGLSVLFPDAATLAGGDGHLPMPAARAGAVRSLATALAEGAVDLGPGADRDDVRRRLLALDGIGPWTAGYIALRALHDPDAFLPGDLAVRRGAVRLGLPRSPAALAERAQAWSPWRAYATHLLWRHGATKEKP